MNQDYKKMLESLLMIYNDSKKNYNVERIEQTVKLINRVRDKYNEHFVNTNDVDGLIQLSAMLKDFDADQAERVIDTSQLAPGRYTFFDKIGKAIKSRKAKLFLAGSLLLGAAPTIVSCTSKAADDMNKVKEVETVKEQNEEYSSDNLIENGSSFAELSAKYGQYLGYTPEELAYLSTEFTGYIPDPHTAEKFNMPELISEGDAATTISQVKTTFDNMFHLGLANEDREAFVNLFDNKDDQKIISSFLDVYYNVYSNPTSTETKAKLIEELKDYNNQHNTASTDMANLFLASGFDAIRGVTLIGDRTAQDEQIEILTDAIIKDININVTSNGVGCIVDDEKSMDVTAKDNIDLTENQSVYTNIRNNLKTNYQDFVKQASYAKDIKGETTLDMTGKEIAKAIEEKIKDLKNSEIDVTEEIANGYRERYDNSSAEQSRKKVTGNDVIKKDPSTGQDYIYGGSTSEDLSDKELPNKDHNGNDTNMDKEDMLDYADLAAKDFNAGKRNDDLYNSNSVYRHVWDELKAFQDANNVTPPAPGDIVDENTEVEIKPSEQNNNDQGNINPEEELPTVPEDYIPPKPGDIVDVETDVEIIPTDSGMMNSAMEQYTMNADGTWEIESSAKTR